MSIKNNCFAAWKELKTHRVWNKHWGLNLFPNCWTGHQDEGRENTSSCQAETAALLSRHLRTTRFFSNIWKVNSGTGKFGRFGITQTSAVIFSPWTYMTAPQSHKCFCISSLIKVSKYQCISASLQWDTGMSLLTPEAVRLFSLPKGLFSPPFPSCASSPLAFSIVEKIIKVSRQAYTFNIKFHLYCKYCHILQSISDTAQ